MKRNVRWAVRFAGVMVLICSLLTTQVGSAFAMTNRGVDTPASPLQEQQLNYSNTYATLSPEDIELLNSLQQELERNAPELLAAQPGSVQPQGVFACIGSITVAIAANVIVVNRVRAVITAVGGVARFVNIIRNNYDLAIRLGLGRQEAIRQALREAGRTAGLNSDAIAAFIIEFSALGGVIDNCFPE